MEIKEGFASHLYDQIFGFSIFLELPALTHTHTHLRVRDIWPKNGSLNEFSRSGHSDRTLDGWMDEWSHDQP